MKKLSETFDVSTNHLVLIDSDIPQKDLCDDRRIQSGRWRTGRVVAGQPAGPDAGEQELVPAAVPPVHGTTPYNFLLSTRITRAKELLVLTDFSVCEIAHQVGFGDESNFSTRFTAMVGQSPQQYRKSAMKPAEN